MPSRLFPPAAQAKWQKEHGRLDRRRLARVAVTPEENGAAVLASLRNLANGLYELEREGERTKVDTLKSWCQQQAFSSVWPLLCR